MFKVQFRADESKPWHDVPGVSNQAGARYLAGLVASGEGFPQVRVVYVEMPCPHGATDECIECDMLDGVASESP